MRSRILLSAAFGALMATAALAQDAAPIDPMDRPGGPTAVGGRGADPNLLRRLPSQRQWESSASAQAYVAKAKALAGDDADLKFDFNVYCKPSGGSLTTDRASLGVPEGAPYAPFPAPSPAIVMPPQHLFDNFWWFGNSGVGAWLITTRDGYILFDALDDADEARDVLIGGMKKAGLDPAKIKYMIFGHSHLDHTGGGRYIQELYHPKVIMGRDDWTAYFKSLASGTGQAARIKDHTPMTHDIDAEDGMKVTLGGVTGTIYQMTGHTVGSIGMIVPVTYQGKQHPILLVTAATDVPNRESFVGGYEHIWNEGIKAKVESVMQVHPNTNINLLARTKYVTDHYPPAKNPLLYGADKTRRYLEIMRACTQARMDALGW